MGVGSLTILPLAAADNLVHDLGTLPGDNYSVALAINKTGAVVGWSGLDFGYQRKRAFLWENGTMTNLGSLGGTLGTWATDINGRGQIVGSSYNASNYEHPFLWEKGNLTDLNVSAATGGARAINDAGQIVGWRLVRTNDSSNPYANRGFLWQNGTVKDLGTLPGFRDSYATAINDAGQVVGFVQDPAVQGPIHAFLWGAGIGMTDLGALPGDALSEASDISAAGAVVGWSGNHGETHAFLREPGGSMRSLGSPAGNTSAYGINRAGQIVGSNGTTAVVWHDGIETPLEPLVPGRSSVAYDVNNAGAAVGQGEAASGQFHAVLWEQVVPVHDVAVTASAQNPYPTVGETVEVDLVGRNLGNRPETFDLAASVGPYFLGRQTVTLAPSSSITLRFSWNTTGVPPGPYSLNATATPVPGETNLGNNVFRNDGAIVVFLRLEAIPSASTSETDVGVPILFACDKTDRVAPFGPYRFSWAFGDGDHGVGDRVRHAYASPGIKTVTCTVTEENGENATAPVTVQIQPRPSIQATADWTAVSPGTSVTFSAGAMGGSGRYTFDWRFGDGGAAIGATAIHAYAAPGDYDAVVSVNDSFGGTAPVNGTIRIRVSLIATMTSVSQQEAKTDEWITFAATAAGGAGGPYRYVWDFGDGASLEGSSVTHAYAQPGVYVPKIAVTDAAGITGEYVLPPITIRSPGPPAATGIALDQDTTKLILGILVVAVVAGAVLSVRRRRPPRP